MAAYLRSFHHVVISTAHRQRVLDKQRRDELYKMMWGFLRQHRGVLHRIGGVSDHVHLLISLHPDVSLGRIVDDLKTASAAWIATHRAFPKFTQWQQGYAAFTHALADKDRLVEFIKLQEKRHKDISFRDEYVMLLAEADLKIEDSDPDWLDDDEEYDPADLAEVLGDDIEGDAVNS